MSKSRTPLCLVNSIPALAAITGEMEASVAIIKVKTDELHEFKKEAHQKYWRSIEAVLVEQKIIPDFTEKDRPSLCIDGGVIFKRETDEDPEEAEDYEVMIEGPNGEKLEIPEELKERISAIGDEIVEKLNR